MLELLTISLMLAASPQDADPPVIDPPVTEETVVLERSDPPSLDELLGLDEEENSTGGAETVADDEHQEELERALAEVDLGEMFQQALDQMSRSAVLLDEDFDSGIGTQRIQEDVIAKLDRLIEEAQRQQDNSSSSSSSSSQSQSNQQNPGRQQQSSSEQQSEGESQNPSNSAAGGDPGAQDGALNPVLDETRAEWGTLPERIRDMLFQGSRDSYSSLYDQLTQEYYQRLAEEVGN